MKFLMRDLGFFKSENDVTMNRRNKFPQSPYTPFDIHQINSTGKIRDSPTSSILKTPTAIFVTTRSSSAKTKRLKFANGPVDLQTLRNGSHESSVSFDSSTESNEDRKSSNNGEIVFEDNVIEVAISPVKTMQVSPDSWKAFLEYKKYNDYANETEKTDYTYSRLSKYRHKEIIPGFLVRPNLSRSSISSRRCSSLSLPSSRWSFNESYNSGGYEFNVCNYPNSEIVYDFKTPNQSNKFTRSKYYLRSSTLDGADAGEVELKPTYFENEYFGNSTPEEKFVKKVAYTTTTTSTTGENESSTPYYTKLRAMNLDDEDIDEVDENPVEYDQHYYSETASAGARIWPEKRPQSVTGSVGNFFTAIFFYVTSVGTVTKDLFSKYVLRRKEDDWSQSSSGSWKNENLGYATASGSWVPWSKENAYATGSYYSSGYYDQPRSWYQRLYGYFYDSFSKVSNVLWGSSAGYATSRYYDPSSRRRKRFWWFLIPLLLLAGSFLGYIDFFSNPKAILSTLYNWVLFFPSFLTYTFTVFIPRLIFELVPYFFLTAIPNFVIVTLPYFLMTTLPYYFWATVHFFASISFASVWGMVAGAFNFAYYLVAAAGQFLYNFSISTLTGGYSLSSNYLMLFYSNFCTTAFNLFTRVLGWVFYSFDFAHHAFDYIWGLFK